VQMNVTISDIALCIIALGVMSIANHLYDWV
jgi:hypothetical protein